MADRPSSDKSSYGKFLETLLESERKETQSSGAPPPEAAAVEEGHELGGEMARVLKLLDERGPTAVAELLKASGLRYQTFFDTVERLRSVNLVEPDTASGEEVLTLTDGGRALVGVLKDN